MSVIEGPRWNVALKVEPDVKSQEHAFLLKSTRPSFDFSLKAKATRFYEMGSRSLLNNSSRFVQLSIFLKGHFPEDK